MLALYEWFEWYTTSLLCRLVFWPSPPPPDSWRLFQSWFKRRPTHWTYEVPDGYLMFRFHFADGSHLDFRSPPDKYKTVWYHEKGSGIS